MLKKVLWRMFALLVMSVVLTVVVAGAGGMYAHAAPGPGQPAAGTQLDQGAANGSHGAMSPPTGEATSGNEVSTPADQQTTNGLSLPVRFVVLILRAIVDALQGFGLQDASTLVFLDSAEGKYTYGGVFSAAEWQQYVMRWYPTFAYIAAAILLLAAIVWGLRLQYDAGLRNNPHVRARAGELLSGWALAVVGTALGLAAVRGLLALNFDIVRALAPLAQHHNFSDIGQLLGQNRPAADLAALVAQLLALGLLIRLNFTYIFRWLDIALLTVLSPILGGAVFAFPGGAAQGWKFWWHLFSQIFIQSLHALVLVLFFSLVDVSTVQPLYAVVFLIAFFSISDTLWELWQPAGSRLSLVGAAGLAGLVGLAGVISHAGTWALGALAPAAGQAAGAAAGAVTGGRQYGFLPATAALPAAAGAAAGGLVQGPQAGQDSSSSRQLLPGRYERFAPAQAAAGGPSAPAGGQGRLARGLHMAAEAAGTLIGLGAGSGELGGHVASLGHAAVDTVHAHVTRAVGSIQETRQLQQERQASPRYGFGAGPGGQASAPRAEGGVGMGKAQEGYARQDATGTRPAPLAPGQAARAEALRAMQAPFRARAEKVRAQARELQREWEQAIRNWQARVAAGEKITFAEYLHRHPHWD